MKVWVLETYDGISRHVRPDQALVIKRKMKTDKHIFFHDEVIAVANIKHFDEGGEMEEHLGILSLPDKSASETEPVKSPNHEKWLELLKRNRDDQKRTGKYGLRRSLDDLEYTDAELRLFAALGLLDRPKLNEPEKVYYKWGKRVVTNKEYERKFADRSNIQKLDNQGSDVVVAFKVIVGKPLKEGVQLCNDLESWKLEQHTNAMAHAR